MSTYYRVSTIVGRNGPAIEKFRQNKAAGVYAEFMGDELYGVCAFSGNDKIKVKKQIIFSDTKNNLLRSININTDNAQPVYSYYNFIPGEGTLFPANLTEKGRIGYRNSHPLTNNTAYRFPAPSLNRPGNMVFAPPRTQLVNGKNVSIPPRIFFIDGNNYAIRIIDVAQDTPDYVKSLKYMGVINDVSNGVAYSGHKDTRGKVFYCDENGGISSAIPTITKSGSNYVISPLYFKVFSSNYYYGDNGNKNAVLYGGMGSLNGVPYPKTINVPVDRKVSVNYLNVGFDIDLIFTTTIIYGNTYNTNPLDRQVIRNIIISQGYTSGGNVSTDDYVSYINQRGKTNTQETTVDYVAYGAFVKPATASGNFVFKSIDYNVGRYDYTQPATWVSQFAAPTAVAIDNDYNLYVTDMQSVRILKPRWDLSETGEVFEAFTILGRPLGINVPSDARNVIREPSGSIDKPNWFARFGLLNGIAVASKPVPNSSYVHSESTPLGIYGIYVNFNEGIGVLYPNAAYDSLNYNSYPYNVAVVVDGAFNNELINSVSGVDYKNQYGGLICRVSGDNIFLYATDSLDNVIHEFKISKNNPKEVVSKSYIGKKNRIVNNVIRGTLNDPDAMEKSPDGYNTAALFNVPAQINFEYDYNFEPTTTMYVTEKRTWWDEKYKGRFCGIRKIEQSDFKEQTIRLYPGLNFIGINFDDSRVDMEDYVNIFGNKNAGMKTVDKLAYKISKAYNTNLKLEEFNKYLQNPMEFSDFNLVSVIVTRDAEYENQQIAAKKSGKFISYVPGFGGDLSEINTQLGYFIIIKDKIGGQEVLPFDLVIRGDDLKTRNMILGRGVHWISFARKTASSPHPQSITHLTNQSQVVSMTTYNADKKLFRTAQKMKSVDNSGQTITILADDFDEAYEFYDENTQTTVRYPLFVMGRGYIVEVNVGTNQSKPSISFVAPNGQYYDSW